MHASPEAAHDPAAMQGGILWELLHGVTKTSVLGKIKRGPNHPCDISVTLGPQVRSLASLWPSDPCRSSHVACAQCSPKGWCVDWLDTAQ